MTDGTENSFQKRVGEWLLACFGPKIAADKIERNHRFLEEALELVQSCGCTQSEAHQLVDYVYGRPVGEIGQEVGGVMNTLAALCLAHGFDMAAEGDIEIARCWTKIEKIRAKQAAKPKHSPLAAASPIQRVRHKARGSSYAVVGEATLQTGGSLTDMQRMTVYRSEHDGSLWVRPTDEFLDGRFEVLE